MVRQIQIYSLQRILERGRVEAVLDYRERNIAKYQEKPETISGNLRCNLDSLAS
jgi:hypothetical protein